MKPTDDPLVSIILCFYNEQKFLQEAVASVLNQTYENWELLLVDDGSSDDSVRIAKDFAASMPDKIFYLEHPDHQNKGLSASRNLGIKAVQGLFVAFIDADDVWLPEKLANQIRIFSGNPGVTVILEASNYWRSWSNPKAHDVVVPVGAREGIYTPPALIAKLYPLGQGAAPCPSGIMVTRAALQRCNFEESFRGIYQMYEDQAFLCKVYLKETVYVSAGCNNLYRQRPSSLVSSVHDGGKYDQVRKYYLRWFRQYLDQVPTKFPQVKALLENAELPYTHPKWHWLTVQFPARFKEIVAKLTVRLGIISYRKSW